MKIYCHPRCGTCKKALKFLDEHNVSYEYLNLLDTAPSKDEIKKYHLKSELPIKKLFNTSGKVYREKGLKDIIPTLTDDEVYELLASDGLLIKRPLTITDEFVSFGYKEEDYKEKYV